LEFKDDNFAFQPNGVDQGSDRVRDLFQWAILMNKKETAWILWNNMADQLPAAIAAVAILNALAKIPYAESKVLVKYGFKGVVVDSL